MARFAARGKALIGDAIGAFGCGIYPTKAKRLFYCIEILGLGATYIDNYKNGTEEERAEYSERFDAFYSYVQKSEPVGRSLDFLIQEMNREVNTISSKIGDMEVTKIVLELKSIIEQIREQIQNLE